MANETFDNLVTSLRDLRDRVYGMGVPVPAPQAAGTVLTSSSLIPATAVWNASPSLTSLKTSDGTVTNPAWTWTNDLFSGRYRIGVNNYGESVASTLVFDWNAARLTLASGYNLVLQGTGTVQAGNTVGVAYGFNADATTGMSYEGTSQLGFRTGGNTSAYLNFGSNIIQVGSAQAIQWSNNAQGNAGTADLGMVRNGAGQWILRQTASIGIGLDVGTDGTAKFRNRAFNADAAITAGTISTSGTYQISGNNFANATVGPSTPTGTTSTTLVMAGLAGSITTRTGKIVLSMSGVLADSVANDGTKLQMSYGTGTAPINGATLTGTQVGPIQQFNAANVAAETAPYGATWIVTGLSAGTVYWFDTAFAAITGGTASLTQASMIAYDIP